MREDAQTVQVADCNICPDAWWWPMKNLILDRCPFCGRADESGKTWRMVAARRLLDSRERGGS